MSSNDSRAALEIAVAQLELIAAYFELDPDVISAIPLEDINEELRGMGIDPEHVIESAATAKQQAEAIYSQSLINTDKINEALADPENTGRRSDLIRDAHNAVTQTEYPLRGTLLYYNDPTSPSGEDDWSAMK